MLPGCLQSPSARKGIAACPKRNRRDRIKHRSTCSLYSGKMRKGRPEGDKSKKTPVFWKTRNRRFLSPPVRPQPLRGLTQYIRAKRQTAYALRGWKSIVNGRACRNFHGAGDALTDCRRGASSCSSQSPYPSADWGSAVHSRARILRRSHDLQTSRSASFLSSSCGIIVPFPPENKPKTDQRFSVFHKKRRDNLCILTHI